VALLLAELHNLLFPRTRAPEEQQLQMSKLARMSKKSKKDQRRHKEMRKVSIILKRLALPQHRMHWLEQVRKEQRKVYTELQQLCALFATSHRASDPLHALYRFNNGQFHALPPVSPCLLDADGQPLPKPLRKKALSKLCHAIGEGSGLRELEELDSAQRLFLLYQKQDWDLRTAETRDGPTACLLTLEHETRRAYYTTSEKSERRWGPVMVLRKPEREVTANLARLEQTLARLQALVKAVDGKKAKHTKRERTEEPEREALCKELRRTRVRVLDRLDEEDEATVEEEEVTLGSQDSFSYEEKLSESKSDDEDDVPYFVESGDDDEETCSSCDDDDDDYDEDYNLEETTSESNSQ
jgi:hypothetical protein